MGTEAGGSAIFEALCDFLLCPSAPGLLSRSDGTQIVPVGPESSCRLCTHRGSRRRLLCLKEGQRHAPKHLDLFIWCFLCPGTAVYRRGTQAMTADCRMISAPRLAGLRARSSPVLGVRPLC